MVLGYGGLWLWWLTGGVLGNLCFVGFGAWGACLAGSGLLCVVYGYFAWGCLLMVQLLAAMTIVCFDLGFLFPFRLRVLTCDYWYCLVRVWGLRFSVWGALRLCGVLGGAFVVDLV